MLSAPATIPATSEDTFNPAFAPLVGRDAEVIGRQSRQPCRIGQRHHRDQPGRGHQSPAHSEPACAHRQAWRRLSRLTVVPRGPERGAREQDELLRDVSAASAQVWLAEANQLLHELDADCSVSVGVAAGIAGNTATDSSAEPISAYRHRAAVR
jgi:hypothetical protein